MNYRFNMEFEEIGRRIRAARKEKKFTLKQLSEASGVAISTISDLEHGRSKQPESSTLYKLSAALNKDPRYLANIGRVSEQDLGIAPHNTARDRLIPLLRHMIGTNDPLSIYPFTESDGLEWLYCHEPHSDRSYALRNTGHEMTGDGRLSFPVGCTIVFDPIPRPESGDCVLARLDSGVTVFRQYVMDAGNPALHPLNPRYSVISSGFTVISVAIEVRLSLRG